MNLIHIIEKMKHDRFMHNETTYFLEYNLSRHKNVSTIILPFHY
jgi:hypothetical protein